MKAPAQTNDPPSRLVLDGTGAVALAVRRCRTQVICAYPITPSSTIVEKLADDCGSGLLDARFIEVESEHSALAGLIGAAQTGVRTFTATSSQGLAYMHELLHWAAGGRLPIVIANVNRALGTPWNIFCDHQDSISQRDTGWMQIYVESCQEIVDTIPLAYRLAEKVLVPCMVCLDGFILSHTTEVIEPPAQEIFDRFLPPLHLPLRLDTAEPRAFGAPAIKNNYHEIRCQLDQDIHSAADFADEYAEEWLNLTGRYWGRMIPYEVDDAEIVVISAGTISGTVRQAVRTLRSKGERVGALSLRFFRPFPKDLVMRYLEGKTVIVLDRDCSYGSGGAIAVEVRSASYYMESRSDIYSFIVGLGGRDVSDSDVHQMIAMVRNREVSKEGSQWYGLMKEFV